MCAVDCNQGSLSAGKTSPRVSPNSHADARTRDFAWHAHIFGRHLSRALRRYRRRSSKSRRSPWRAAPNCGPYDRRPRRRRSLRGGEWRPVGVSGCAGATRNRMRVRVGTYPRSRRARRPAQQRACGYAGSRCPRTSRLCREWMRRRPPREAIWRSRGICAWRVRVSRDDYLMGHARFLWPRSRCVLSR